MTVTLYTGHVGSGKSYEVVKNVILPAVAAGRSVVANIEGLDVEAVYDFLRDQPGKASALGELTVVDRMDPRRPDFFPVRQADGSYVASAYVPLGALVVIDECPLYWGSDKSILPQHLAFFREHRHITSADGVSCDLVVVSQTVPTVHRSLRDLCEFSLDCRRLAALGLNKKYTVVTYSGAKRSGKFVMGRATTTYDKRIFPLYSSTAHKNGRILRTDKRFSVWASKWFWGVFGLAPVVLGLCLWSLYHRTFGAAVPPVSAIAAAGGPVAAVPEPGVVPVLARSAASAVVAGGFPAAVVGEAKAGSTSPWKVVGSARFQGSLWAVLRRPGFPLRYMPLTACQLSFGFPVSCNVRGEVYEPDSGEAPGGGGGASGWAVDKLAAKSIK